MAHTLSGSLAPARERAGGGAAQQPCLDEKFRIPRPAFPVLHRRRVSALLDRAAQHQVTLVSGPAGAGKTVAVASWAASGPDAGRVVWLTVEPDDRQDWFWMYVCAGLSRARAAPPAVLHALEDTGPDGFPVRLVAAAQDFIGPVVLVLDDVHEATDGGLLTGLDVLVRHAPPALRLVLSARRPPALQLARLRVSGALADIGAVDLACTAEEVRGYFELLGMEVAQAEREEVLRRTEGWMAGIRMAVLEAAPGQRPPGTVAGTAAPALPGEAGAGPLVTEYLWDEVLGRQEPDTRALLIRTSVVSDLPPGLPDALTGGAGGAATLARLTRENCLVTGSGAGGYRYHPMLREVLAAQLHREFPAEVPVLLRRAAHWYAGQGRPLDCVRAAVTARDWDLAATALAGAAVDILCSHPPADLESVLAAFPAGRAAQDAAVAAAWAAARLWDDDPGGAAGYLDSAARCLDRADPATRRVTEPTLAALRIMRAAEQRREEPALIGLGMAAAEAAQALAGSQAEHRGAGLLWFALGCASLRHWDTAAAGHALRHAERQLAAGAAAVLRARARAWLALAQACCGDLAAAQRTAADVRRAARHGPKPAAFLAALAGAQVSLGRDDLAAAQRLLDDADPGPAGHIPGEPPVPAIAELIRARILLADGDPAAARATLGRLRDAWVPVCPGLARTVTVAEAEAALRAGDRGRARALLQLAGGGTDGGCGDAVLAGAGLMLAEGDFPAALRSVRHLLDGAAATTGERTRALLVAAVAGRRLGDTEAAAAAAERALGLAEPQGAYRVFLDGGAAVRAAVTVLVPPTSRYAGFAGRVAERFGRCAPRPGGPGGRASVPLTDSERAVLRFLPSHMTNEEISEALFLSVNTVKTHLRSAYRKLGVRSRREAVARGRRLDLL